MKKTWLFRVYRGWNLTQWCGDYSKPLQGPLLNNPYFMERIRGFFVSHVGNVGFNLSSTPKAQPWWDLEDCCANGQWSEGLVFERARWVVFGSFACFLDYWFEVLWFLFCFCCFLNWINFSTSFFLIGMNSFLFLFFEWDEFLIPPKTWGEGWPSWGA